VEKVAISITEAAEALSISPRTIWSLLSDGKLTGVRVGRRRLVSADSVRAFAQAGGAA
jgi:excisionase family DNA binding protein